jgi:hypothetical protein
VTTWSEAVTDFDDRLKAADREAVARHVYMTGWKTGEPDYTTICKKSILPVAYCGGCFRGEHQ